jgi:hypothetical protein
MMFVRLNVKSQIFNFLRVHCAARLTPCERLVRGRLAGLNSVAFDEGKLRSDAAHL